MGVFVFSCGIKFFAKKVEKYLKISLDLEQ